MRELDDGLASRVELLDFGCGRGRSLLSAQERFGLEGIGLERERKRVVKAQAEGLPVYEADITKVRPEQFPNVRVVTIDNVLEHLPSLDLVEDVVASACRIANDLVYIRHPSFEHEEYLGSLGLKQYWNDWPIAHSTHVRLHELVRFANDQGCYHTLIRPVARAIDSNDSTILPASAPPDQTKAGREGKGVYDPEHLDPKPFVVFDRPVWFAFDVLIVTGATTPTITYRRDPDTVGTRPDISFDPPRPGRSKSAGRGPRAIIDRTTSKVDELRRSTTPATSDRR